MQLFIAKCFFSIALKKRYKIMDVVAGASVTVVQHLWVPLRWREACVNIKTVEVMA